MTAGNMSMTGVDGLSATFTHTLCFPTLNDPYGDAGPTRIDAKYSVPCGVLTDDHDAVPQ